MYEVNTTQENKLTQLLGGLNKTKLAFDTKHLNELHVYLEGARFPTTKDEQWKYTRLTKLTNSTFTGSFLKNSSEIGVQNENAYRIVFDNGNLSFKDSFQGCKSLTELTPSELTFYQAKNELFDALNLVYAEDGVYLDISGELDRPIEIIHLSNGNKVNNLRHYIRLKAQAKAVISMVFEAERTSKNFTNVVTEIQLENCAHLALSKIQVECWEDIQI